jgi:hypothetical protein
MSSEKLPRFASQRSEDGQARKIRARVASNLCKLLILWIVRCGWGGYTVQEHLPLGVNHPSGKKMLKLKELESLCFSEIRATVPEHASRAGRRDGAKRKKVIDSKALKWDLREKRWRVF